MKTNFVAVGDCRESLKTLESDSIDAVVTDPPYELTSARPGGRSPATEGKVMRGFMGMKWDGTGIAYDVNLWREVLRVMKPGAHLLSFGGTRTYHRMACAIEDAGFEIRDQMQWLYGCLPADAEALTAEGWKRGDALTEEDEVAAWDPDSGNIEVVRPERIVRAPYRGLMRVFQNDDVEQVLTPNHRVYHKTQRREQRNGVRVPEWPSKWEVAQASEITRHQPTKFPVAGAHSGPGVGSDGYAALLGWIWAEGGFDKSGTGVRLYQSQSANPEKVREIDALVRAYAPGFKRYDRERPYMSRNGGTLLSAEACWFFSGAPAERVRADLPGKKISWPLVWRMTAAEKVAFLRSAHLGDGSGASIDQKDGGQLNIIQAMYHLTNRSAFVKMRANRPGHGVVNFRNRSTTEVQHRHLHAHPDRQYDGEVWCVTVPTGAFVARYHGKVFVTGNSGFPKSLDVSKAIDRMNGDERPVVGATMRPEGKQFADGQSGFKQGEVLITSAASAAWDGWGTALKPANEPACLARKPLSEKTVAANVLKWGTGALNIDASRIVTADNLNGGAYSGGKRKDGAWKDNTRFKNDKMTGEFKAPEGRWPANVIFSRLEYEYEMVSGLSTIDKKKVMQWLYENA